MASRSQVALPREVLEQARENAARMGLSLAEYFERLVAADGQALPRALAPAVVFDLGRSSGSDVAREKDRLVGEAVAARAVRRRPPR